MGDGSHVYGPAGRLRIRVLNSRATDSLSWQPYQIYDIAFIQKSFGYGPCIVFRLVGMHTCS